MEGCKAVVARILVIASKRGIGTAAALARVAGVAPETISRIRTRDTADFNTVARLAAAAGLELALVPARAAPPETNSKSAALGLQFPYDWSNPGMDDETLIGRVIEKNRFTDVARICKHYGLLKVVSTATKLRLSGRTDIQRTFDNIRAGFGLNAAP